LPFLEAAMPISAGLDRINTGSWDSNSLQVNELLIEPSIQKVKGKIVPVLY
jgi:hypothetical protein